MTNSLAKDLWKGVTATFLAVVSCPSSTQKHKTLLMLVRTPLTLLGSYLPTPLISYLGLISPHPSPYLGLISPYPWLCLGLTSPHLSPLLGLILHHWVLFDKGVERNLKDLGSGIFSAGIEVLYLQYLECIFLLSGGLWSFPKWSNFVILWAIYQHLFSHCFI